jgi:hypothetical protein
MTSAETRARRMRPARVRMDYPLRQGSTQGSPDRRSGTRSRPGTEGEGTSDARG